MFMQFATQKGENIIIPTAKILLISEEKKGVTIVMDDGTPITISESFETVVSRLNRREMLFRANED